MENNSVETEEPIGVCEDEVPVSISYQGTFKNLNYNVQNAPNELKLTENFEYWHGSPYYDKLDITFDGIVMVNKHNFVLDGQGHTICGSGQKGFFIIRSSCSNITIKNCIFIDAGGKFAFDCECPVNIINCTFQNCKGEDFLMTLNLRAGGTVTDCKFIDNYDPIIVKNSASANICGCSFTNCDGTIYGGGIYLTGSGVIENCTFTGNKASYGGGAVCFEGSGTIIRNCIFNGNYATAAGGAVYSKTGNGVIENCRFNNNKAREGGALLFPSSGMTIKNCNFTGNAATKNGGAINFTQGITVENCNFNGNDALKGGALFFETAATNLKNCNFTGNTANDGSAIYVTKSCTLDGLNFNNNVAKGQGAVYINSYNRYYTDSTIRNCIFNNNAANAGGAICFSQLGGSNLQNCIFSKNSASTKGGAVYFSRSEGQKNINNCKFYDNTAEDGGALWANRATVRVSKFTGNSANNGGAVYFNNGGTVEGSDFANNSASNYGGAVYTTSATVRNSNFVNNSASNYGGAVYTASGTVTNSNFVNNSASIAGAICFDKQGTVQGSHFTDNAAQVAGAILMNGSGAVENSVFTNNSAAVIYCGAIMFMSEATVNNCSFVKNNARFACGAVGTVDKLTINDSIFEMNRALSYKHFGVLNDGGSIITNNVLIYNLVNPKLSLGVKDILSDQDAFIEIRLDKTINGNVKLVLNNTEYPVSINDGYGNKTIPNLPSGTYDVIAIFESDGIFNRSVVSATFNVKDIDSLEDPNLTITVADIFVGEDIFIEISANDTLSAVVRVEIEDENYTVNVIDGYGNVSVPNLGHYGNYIAKAIFKHDDIFRNSEKTTTFNILRFNPDLTVDADDVYIGQNATIHVGIDENVAGEVTIEINGTNQTIDLSDGMGNFTISGPVLGNYTFNIFFGGDDLFFDDAKSVSFTVKPKEDPNLIVYAHNGCNGQSAIICVEIDENAVGEVLYDLFPGLPIDMEIVNGKGNFSFFDGPGYYERNITFCGDYRFYSVTKTVSFNITEMEYAGMIVSYPSEIYVGQNLTVCIEINSNIEGSMIISINGMDYPIEITNGKGNYTISNLEVGDFTYTVAFSGDSRFNPDFEFVSFKVLPMDDAGLVVSSSGDCYEGQNVTVYVEIDGNITGNVTVGVDGEDRVVEVVDGKGNHTFSGLIPGNYSYDVVFSGDYRFVSDSKPVSFNVLAKEDAGLVVSSSGDCYEGQNVTVYVEIDGNITGNVTVGVDGEDRVVEVVDGKGNYTFSGLIPGNYSYDVVFSGDYRFVSDSKPVSFKVMAKESPDLIISVDDVYIGQDVIVNVLINENITGNVTVGVDGEDKVVEVVDGKGNFTFSGLSIGNYSYDVVFSGDYRFVSDSKTVSFKVMAKEEPDLKVDAADVYVGQNAVINVLIDDDITENLIIADEGSEKVIEIVNGKGNYTLSGLTVGNYNYMIFFLGNEKYYSNFKAVSFKVLAKEDAGLVVSSSGDCYVGQNVTVYVEIDRNITGNVTVSVDGEDEVIEVVDGKGNYTFSGLSIGNYSYDVVFSGDYRFAGDSKLVSFNVMAKESPDLTISVDDVYVSQDVIVNVSINENIQGNVTININGEDKAIEIVNGKGNYTFTGLIPGNYSYDVVFSGDYRFVSDSKPISFKVMLVDSNLSIQVSDIYQGANAVVKITTNIAFAGKANVKIASNIYVVDVVNGQATLPVSGLVAGTYTATAYIDGDGVFKSSFKSVNFIVKANVVKLTLKKVKIKKSAKKLIIKATLKINGKAVKGKIIKFKFNKKSYKAKTNKNGIAKITVKRNVLKKLKVGKKVKYQATYGKITKKISVKVKK